jgi:hypothetical protein
LGGLRDIVARLVEGTQGRTEADIQADVRAFLLDAPLELEPDQVVEVALEAHVGGGRRIDVEAGHAAIEVKKRLRSKSVFEKARGQLAGYVKQRTEDRSERYVGVLTDGTLWVLFHLDPSGDLVEVSRLELRRAGDGARLAAWLEPVLATTRKIKPSSKQIVSRLGSGSPAAKLDLADLRALYGACRDKPEVQLKRDLWARLLLAALGTNFEDSDELFVMHTYLVLIAELLAHQILGFEFDAAADVRGLLEGQDFTLAGIHGVVEPDFFDWPAVVPEGQPIIASIARRLSTFDWKYVEHDVLKALYESVIDAETRRKLGEYYTPDWLAQKIVEEQFADPLRQRLLDPACGSGTFLFWAIRRLLLACDNANIPNPDALRMVVEKVQGMDLHPVAVTLARVTYLLALTRARLDDLHRGDLHIPVFLGDSVRWQHGDTVVTEEGITVGTADPLELLEDDLHFPESVIEDPVRFDRLVEALAKKAAARQPGSKPPSIRVLLNAHKVLDEPDREAVGLAFRKLCRLHDAGRDHLWSYYIRNRARPLSFMREEGRVDVLVGNPPWLAFRHMPVTLQTTYRTLAEERGLWTGGKVATHQDLSDLFVSRSVEQYLNLEGTFAFVMPFAVLSRRQFAGFRSGNWRGPRGGACADLHQAEDFARVKPPPFLMPSCVISGTKASEPSALPDTVRVWLGRLPRGHLDWASAVEHLQGPLEGHVLTALDESQSPYRERFRQGATLVPRMLVTVEERQRGPLGVAAGRVPVMSARSSNEKRPWKDLASVDGVVEAQFIRPMHLGATIVAYRARTPGLAVIPIVNSELLDSSDERLDEFPGLAEWWRRAEQIWDANKPRRSRLSLRQRIDYHRELSKQLPGCSERVVYTKSGQHLAACRITDPEAVIDHKLYWSPAQSVDEARYLCAVLNSQALADAIVDLQARGQHNPRDFDKHVFAFPFPEFNRDYEIHLRLANLGARAERIASTVMLDDGWQFQKARRIIREALREEGVARDIDLAVEELVAVTSAPDLLGVLSGAADVAATILAPSGRRRVAGRTRATRSPVEKS